MIESNVIVNVSMIIRIINFHFLGNTRAYECKLVRDVHFLVSVNGSTHGGTLYRE